LSYSSTQKTFIEKRAADRGLDNVKVITANIAEFDTELKFDRIVSIEMFEHMRNYSRLFKKLSKFMKPSGKLLVHVFARRGVSYLFDSGDTSDFMAKYFFAGGTMPNVDLIPSLASGFSLEEDWTFNGKHYQKTLETWLKRMKNNKDRIIPILAQTYGEDQDIKWWNYWKIFFIVCAELFGYRDGNEWLVKHYRFVRT
jgi:cyclopropane-fatty-acyl-phospholipid synthase